MNFLKKISLKPAIIWKLVTCQRITSKNTWSRWVDIWACDKLKWYWYGYGYPVYPVWQLSIDHNINVQYVCIISCAPKLARKYEIEHWSPSSKTINWPADSFQINHVTSMSWQMSPRYGQWLSCFDSCQLTILWMSSIKDVDLPRHAWDTPPLLLIVSPTPPVQSVDAYARSITWQPNDHILIYRFSQG